jgi:hypothetical protein
VDNDTNLRDGLMDANRRALGNLVRRAPPDPAPGGGGFEIHHLPGPERLFHVAKMIPDLAVFRELDTHHTISSTDARS